MEAVGTLTGGLAHDFNNILTGIIGYTDLLFPQMEAIPEGLKMKEDLARVRELADRAASLTRQLLAFSRQQPLQPVVLNINALVANFSKMLGRLVGEEIDLQFFPAPDLDNVRADPSQIEEVLMNLAMNARDAMPHGGKLSIETANAFLDEGYAARHPQVAPGHFVMLAVSDTGVGMDEATCQRIFEPFFTTKRLGTGLGLAMIYGTVKQHGGNIYVYSEPGKGTSFKIYLPRVSASRYVGASKDAEQVPIRRGGTETILVVEDEESVRDIARRVLEEKGYIVLSASTPGEAEKLMELHGGKVSLLLTDIVLPERNGRELYESLVAKFRSLKVLYTSGYTENAVLHNEVLTPGTAFIKKPFGTDALVKKVRETLDR
jgi:CheY-like chemotaxis protein